MPPAPNSYFYKYIYICIYFAFIYFWIMFISYKYWLLSGCFDPIFALKETKWFKYLTVSRQFPQNNRNCSNLVKYNKFPRGFNPMKCFNKSFLNDVGSRVGPNTSKLVGPELDYPDAGLPIKCYTMKSGKVWPRTWFLVLFSLFSVSSECVELPLANGFD